MNISKLTKEIVDGFENYDGEPLTEINRNTLSIVVSNAIEEHLKPESSKVKELFNDLTDFKQSTPIWNKSLSKLRDEFRTLQGTLDESIERDSDWQTEIAGLKKIMQELVDAQLLPGNTETASIEAFAKMQKLLDKTT